MFYDDFIGREEELSTLNAMHEEKKFHLFVLYGRRRVGKTTLLNQFCKNKEFIFFSAEQSNNKLNLEKFSALVFSYYGETVLEPFSEWENALTYIANKQQEKRLILVFDEFPYLAKKNKVLLSQLQHLIDLKLKYSNLFIILCGSYMSFMEKEVLGAKSPLFGRRTAQLHMKPFDYRTSIKFAPEFTEEERLKLYGAYGGTALYLRQIDNSKSFEENIKNSFLKVTAYLYEEPLLLLRQEVTEPSIYSAVIEAIAGGATKANEIATKIGEDCAKCLKYIGTLCELGIVYKETPFGEKESSRKTIYGISDFMFRFWYRYVFGNRSLLETGAVNAVWTKRIEPEFNDYMGTVFERICHEYMTAKNATGQLPILFTSIGRWWGTNPKDKSQVEIDLVATDGNDYMFCECKWRNEKLGSSILKDLRSKSNVFLQNKKNSFFVLFSKSGFTDSLIEESKNDSSIILVGIEDIIKG